MRWRQLIAFAALIGVVCCCSAALGRHIYDARGFAHVQSTQLPLPGAHVQNSNLLPVAMRLAYHKGPEMHTAVETSVCLEGLMEKWRNHAKDLDAKIPERDMYALEMVEEAGMFVNYTCKYDRYDTKKHFFEEYLYMENSEPAERSTDKITHWVTGHTHDRFQGAYTHIFESIETAQRFLFPRELLTQILDSVEIYRYKLFDARNTSTGRPEGAAGRYIQVTKHEHYYIKYAFDVPGDTHTQYTAQKWKLTPVGFLGTQSNVHNVYTPVRLATVLLTADTYELAEISYYSDKAASDKTLIVRYEVWGVDRK